MKLNPSKGGIVALLACGPCRKPRGMMETWCSGDPAARPQQDTAVEKASAVPGRSSRCIVWESLRTSMARPWLDWHGHGEVNSKGSRCRGRLLAQPGDSLSGGTKAEQGHEPRGARRGEQCLNSAAKEQTSINWPGINLDGNYLTASEPQGRRLMDGFPQGCQQPSWFGGGGSCKDPSVCPRAIFLPGILTRGWRKPQVGYQETWSFWHRLCHAGLGYAAQQRC